MFRQTFYAFPGLRTSYCLVVRFCAALLFVVFPFDNNFTNFRLHRDHLPFDAAEFIKKKAGYKENGQIISVKLCIHCVKAADNKMYGIAFLFPKYNVYFSVPFYAVCAICADSGARLLILIMYNFEIFAV